MVTRCTGTIKNAERFIRRSNVFSICETRRKMRSNSFSFSRCVRSMDAEPWRLQYVSKA